MTAAALAAAVYFFLIYHPNSGPEEGGAAPDFSLQDRNGVSVTLSNLRGKYVLVHFWATWCATCTHEMPRFNAMATHLDKNPNLAILGLSLDDTGRGNGWKAVESFEKTIPIAFRVLMDSRGKVADQYGTYALPETYLVGPNGAIVRKFVGEQAWDSPKLIGYLESEVSKEIK